jgi:hypothetical protein
MRAKFIYEKFSLDSDPIHDLDIGISKIIKGSVKKMFEYDYKKNYLITLSKQFKYYSTGCSLSHIGIFDNKLTINFYSNGIYDVKTKKQKNKIKYAKHLLKCANISQFIEEKIVDAYPKNEPKDATGYHSYPYNIIFQIKSKYVKYFKTGTHYPNQCI